MRAPRTVLGALVPVLLLLACAGSPRPKSPGPRAPVPLPSPAALLVALEGERGPELAAVEARLVAQGARAVPALRRALAAAEGESRLRILGVLDEIGRVPGSVGAEERLDVILWRLRGGSGSPADRPGMLARLSGAGREMRAALARRAGKKGPDRPLALFALAATGDARAVEILSAALDADDERARAAAAAGLELLTGVDWIEAGTAERARLLRRWGEESAGRQG